SNPKSLVTFLVGPGSTEFLIHKEVVWLHSDILSAAFNSGFTEDQTQTYRLEDTSEGTFRLFMQWLYCQNFKIIQGPEHIYPENCPLEWAEDTALVELWVLADKFVIPRLQNFIIDTMQKIFEYSNYIPVHTFHYLYINTAMDSLLRRYIVRLCVVFAHKSLYDKFYQYFPHDMLVDIAMEYASRAETLDRPGLSVADYHVDTSIG
ncbi:hypothetical protein BKA61DRAFT_489554, partial [Leptodontidium sp. MPI-SDFR-AT-0119]